MDDAIELDTVVVVEPDGTDHMYNTKTHPGIDAHIVPGASDDQRTLWITIPLLKGRDFQ